MRAPKAAASSAVGKKRSPLATRSAATGEVVGVGVEVVEGEAAGGVNVGPAVGGEDGAIHLVVQVAEVEDVGVGFGGVVEAVVGVGEALVVAHHEVGAVVVVGFADFF